MHAAALGATVLFLGSALAVILGVLLVGRPVRMLSESVRALGEGKQLPPIVLRGRRRARASWRTS